MSSSSLRRGMCDQREGETFLTPWAKCGRNLHHTTLDSEIRWSNYIQESLELSEGFFADEIRWLFLLAIPRLRPVNTAKSRLELVPNIANARLQVQ